MAHNAVVSARLVNALLARILGPEFYDDPRFGRGDGRRRIFELVAGPHPEPWREVALNPQPLPPRLDYALRLADTHLGDVLALDRLGVLHGGETQERSLKRALSTVAEIDEICPRWPRWPKNWPPPPPPPWQREEMDATELLVLGVRAQAAAELAENEDLRGSLERLADKALDLAQRG